MQPNIICFDLDTFFVSVERILDPSLDGKPVIVGGDPEGRSVVSAASYEAREYGVKSGMPVKKALRMCPQATFIRGKWDIYSAASRRFFRILQKYSPLVDPASVDEAYVDVSGTSRLFGPPIDVAWRIQREVMDRLRLPLSAGISTGEVISKVASGEAKPAGLLEVLPGYEKRFLAPLPLKKLPGAGPSFCGHVRKLGIETIGDLARTELFILRREFGKHGQWLHEWANGNAPDDSHGKFGEVKRKSVGASTTLSVDTDDWEKISGVLWELCEDVGMRLRRRGWMAWRITVRIRHADFENFSRAATLPRPVELDYEIFRAASKELRKLCPNRALVRLVGVSVSRLVPAARQLDLFDQNLEKRRRMQATVDALRNKYHTEILRTGRAITTQYHPPLPVFSKNND